MPGGGLLAEHVPWLVRAGRPRRSTSARRCGRAASDKAYVDAGYVRSWRLLLDDAMERL